MFRPSLRSLSGGLLVLSVSLSARAGDFGAYYTKIASGEAFEQDSRTGPYADVVVDLGAERGRLVFWRGSSYLPYWETAAGRWYVPELVPRSGDGRGRMPDRVNTYSRVAVIESTARRVLVHWRYLPHFGGGNPHTGVDAAAFVDELFAVTPDGRVTRTVRQGTARYDAWSDPGNRRIQHLRLERDGLTDEGTAGPEPPRALPRVPGNPLREGAGLRPCCHWRFDEARGDATVEAVGGASCPIAGPRSFWKAGVSGTALHFDGYTSCVSLPAGQAPPLARALTLEAWTALGAYPWNWAPLVQQGDDTGWFLGIDGHGHAGFKVQVGDRWEELVATETLARRRWIHIAGTFDGDTGTLRLFLDGRVVATKSVAPGPLRGADADIQIGQGRARRPVDPVRASTFSDRYAYDGLIDEVRIYDRALTPGQVASSYRALQPPEALREQPDMDRRALPAGPVTDRFGARYTHLHFYETWDALWRFGDYPDVVVGFDALPVKFVFWRGTGFIPMLVNERGQWYSNEFNETWGTSGGRGCQEPMSDKESYANHVRVIENSPARVVVHWRYPLVDVQHVTANYDPATGWGDWSDWIYTIYPDGTAFKRMHLWTAGRRNHEWQESMAIFGPDQHPEQVIETRNTLTLADARGRGRIYDWSDGPPRIAAGAYRGRCIQLVNYRGEFDPFTIGAFTGGDVYSGELRPYAVFPTWNHWPVAQMPSDGRYASFPDRAGHSSLTHLRLPVYREDFGDRPFQERLLVEGMTNRGAAALAPLARSWLRAPVLEPTGGCVAEGYDRTQGAWPLVAREARLSWRVDANEARPLVNPCFVVRNWGHRDTARVTVDGRRHPADADTRQGTIRDTDGTYSLVLWLRLTATRPLRIAIDGARPDRSRPIPATATWAEPPRVTGRGLSVTLCAAPVTHPSGVAYRFVTAGPGADALDSGWQASPRFTAKGLAPNRTYSFRVQARNRFHVETAWSEPVSARTGDAPGPVARWPLDEGHGRAVGDARGRHVGRIEGAVTWGPGHAGRALRFTEQGGCVVEDAADLDSSGAFTWSAWIQTRQGGTILARSPATGPWRPGGKVLFVSDGRLVFDVGWVGQVRSEQRVADGRWHHVAVSVRAERRGHTVALYVDGEVAGRGALDVAEHDEEGLVVKIGACSEDFPEPAGFTGLIDELRWYPFGLGPSLVRRLAAGGLGDDGS